MQSYKLHSDFEKLHFIFTFRGFILNSNQIFQMASSTSSQNNFDLNVVPNAQPEVQHSSFQSQNGPITVNDSVMMSDITATTVVVGTINP